MGMKNLFLIINPVAGRGMYKNGLGEALHVLHSAGYVPTVRFTTRAGEAVELAQQSVGYDLVCCMGGDGTLSDVIEGLMRLEPGERPPIGYFPLGTANDVATTLRLPKGDSAACARRIAGGEERWWDVGGLGDGRCFTYIAAFGAFTDVSYETPQQNKQALGHLAYLLEGMNRLTRLPHCNCRVELDNGEVEEGDYIFGGVTNSLSVAGLIKLDPELVGLDDGKFEISLVRNPGNLSELNALMGQAVSKNTDGPALKILHASQVHFEFEKPMTFTRDGEPGGTVTELTITNHRRAVRIIC